MRIIVLLSVFYGFIFAGGVGVDSFFHDYNGTVVTDLGSTEDVNATLIQSDGKILVGGTTNGKLMLARYTSSGVLDTSFGVDANGTVITDLSGASVGESIKAMALQSDGKIVATGTKTSGSDVNITLLRYNTDGTLDTSFGTDGNVTFNYFNNNEEGNDVKIQSDGKIVVIGDSFDSSYVDKNITLVRFDTNGILDSSFGIDGNVTYDNLGMKESAKAGVIQSDDKIVVTGYTANSALSDMNITVVRFNSDGSLDTSFGTNGNVSIGSSAMLEANAIVLQGDKIVVAGRQAGSIFLARFTSTGGIDTTFGPSSEGNVTTFISSGVIAKDVKVASDGTILVSASDGTNSYLVRYTTNGVLDESFYGVGYITGYGISDKSMAIQSDGKVVTAGNTNGDIKVSRFVIDATPPIPTFTTNTGLTLTDGITNVPISTSYINIAFDSAIRESNGSELTTTDINSLINNHDFIQLKVGNHIDGDNVHFTAEIDSAKQNIKITPFQSTARNYNYVSANNFDYSTTYYLSFIKYSSSAYYSITDFANNSITMDSESSYPAYRTIQFTTEAKYIAPVVNTVSVGDTSLTVPIGVEPVTDDLGTVTTHLDPVTIDGLTSQTVTEIEKDGLATSTITTTDKTGETEVTSIEAPNDIDIKLSSDGSVENTLRVEDTVSDIEDETIQTEVESTVTLKAQATGEVSTKLEIVNKKDSTKVEREFNVPNGAKASISSTGTVTTVNKFIENINDNEVESKVEAKTDGSLIASLIEYEKDNLRGTQKAVTKATFSARKVFEKVKLEVLMDRVETTNKRAVKRIKQATLKATYTARKQFSYKSSKILRELIDTSYNISSVTIVPKSLWQRYEELHKLDGTRVIKLMLGIANIIIDGKEQEMEKEVEYPLPALEIEETVEEEVKVEIEYKSKGDVFKDGKLKISKGWNLLAIPVDIKDANLSMFQYDSVWLYNNNQQWVLSVSFFKLPTNVGFYLKSQTEQEIEFKGKEYQPNLDNLLSGWNLMGTGIDLEDLNKTSEFKSVWTYKNEEWSKNPEIIYQGQGFWINK